MFVIKKLTTGQLAGFILVVFTLVFFARSIYSVAPELGGDALRKWQTSITIAETNDLTQLVQDRHHSARWGINFPLVALIKAGGSSASNYMLIPMLLYSGIFIGSSTGVQPCPRGHRQEGDSAEHEVTIARRGCITTGEIEV